MAKVGLALKRKCKPMSAAEQSQVASGEMEQTERSGKGVSECAREEHCGEPLFTTARPDRLFERARQKRGAV
ncbi:hypothetical protein AB1Y20_009400 [Prymnesium parvum]|uniref:Uncharacterized protein n=1 Tax=Prymnesium parvum TaxID=97485 RepID=A0AB34K4Z0_PRYPA